MLLDDDCFPWCLLHVIVDYLSAGELHAYNQQVLGRAGKRAQVLFGNFNELLMWFFLAVHVSPVRIQKWQAHFHSTGLSTLGF